MISRIQKIATVTVTALTLAAASYAYAASYLITYVYWDDNGKIVGSHNINQCSGHSWTSGTVTSRKTLMSKELCSNGNPK